MTSHFQEQFLLNLPPALKQHIPPAQLLLSPDAVGRVRDGFAAFGSVGMDYFQQLMAAIHVSLAAAVTKGFLAGTFLIAIGFLATLFLREIPLRKSNRGESCQ